MSDDSITPGLLGRAARALAGDTFYVLATQVISKGVLTLLTVLMARSLSVAQFSIFTFFIVTSGVLTSYVSLGLPLAASRIWSERNADRSWSADPRAAAIVFLGLVISVASLVTAPIYLPLLTSDEIRIAGVIVVVGALASAWNALGQAAMYATRSFRQAFVPALVATLATCAAAGVAAVTGNAYWLIAGNILFMLVPMLAYAAHLGRIGALPPLTRSLAPPRDAVARALAIALPGLGVTLIFATMHWAIARTLVEHQTMLDQFNQYLVAMQWVSLVLFVPLGFGQAVFPRFIEAARAETARIRDVAAPAGFTFVTVAALAALAALATPMIDLIYGANYRFDPAFVFIVLLAGAFGGAVNLTGSYVMAIRGTGTWFAVNLGSVAIGLPLLILYPPATALDASRILCTWYAALLGLACVAVWLDHRRTRVRGRDKA